VNRDVEAVARSASASRPGFRICSRCSVALRACSLRSALQPEPHRIPPRYCQERGRRSSRSESVTSIGFAARPVGRLSASLRATPATRLFGLSAQANLTSSSASLRSVL